MNRGGVTMFVILLAIVYFMFGMILYQFLKPDITLARADLSCSAPSTAGDMFTCLIIDGIVPMVIIGVISAAGGIVTQGIFK